MKDDALEQIWRRRKSLTQKCGNDPHKLVKHLQDREKTRKAEQMHAPNKDSADAPSE